MPGANTPGATSSLLPPLGTPPTVSHVTSGTQTRGLVPVVHSGAESQRGGAGLGHTARPRHGRRLRGSRSGSRENSRLTRARPGWSWLHAEGPAPLRAPEPVLTTPPATEDRTHPGQGEGPWERQAWGSRVVRWDLSLGPRAGRTLSTKGEDTGDTSSQCGLSPGRGAPQAPSLALVPGSASAHLCPA